MRSKIMFNMQSVKMGKCFTKYYLLHRVYGYSILYKTNISTFLRDFEHFILRHQEHLSDATSPAVTSTIVFYCG